jgi:hypothetical protein
MTAGAEVKFTMSVDLTDAWNESIDLLIVRKLLENVRDALCQRGRKSGIFLDDDGKEIGSWEYTSPTEWAEPKPVKRHCAGRTRCVSEHRTGSF